LAVVVLASASSRERIPDEDIAGAVSLARAFIALSRSEQSGVLEVWGDGTRAKVTVVDGIPTAATAVAGADALLGDTLLRAGQFNWEAHQAVMCHVQPERPVGHWLVKMGIATRLAVQTALGKQLRSRLLLLFSLRKLEYQFVRDGGEVRVPPVGSALSVSELVLHGLKDTLTYHALNQVRKRISGKILRLTPLGRFFLDDSLLEPDEAQIVRLLEVGADFLTIEKAIPHAESALRTVAALLLLSAATADSNCVTLHTLLARKHRQLRANVGPRALLDLPPCASPAQAGRALRRLTAQLHPDRLGPDAPYALHQVSGEVIRALTRAETELRPRRQTQPVT
jgi:hypothetical protein